MGLIQQILEWFGLARRADAPSDSPLSGWVDAPSASSSAASPPAGTRRLAHTPKLVPLSRKSERLRNARWSTNEVDGTEPPYRYAHYGSQSGRFLDLSQDGSPEKLARYGLPNCHTPEQLADWLGLSPKLLAWLTHYTTNGRPRDLSRAHYHYHWMRKRTSGWRLIESPKPVLKAVQLKILDELLAQVPVHDAAHGFEPGRSIVSNAQPHCGQDVLLKIDLENFYGNVHLSRVVAIYRSLGYSREAAIWLARLTTSALPSNMPFPDRDPHALHPFLPTHLPQGAPTSPALANLSAFSLDVRLSGLARSFGGTYTRYADDLTVSGPDPFARSLKTFIPLAEQVIRSERFRVHRGKRRVIRSHQRQIVTGVVVNEKPNCARDEFDRLKAILTNCLRHGAASQNREQVPNWPAHLQGRIAHLRQLNPSRGARLQDIYDRIEWTR